MEKEGDMKKLIDTIQKGNPEERAEAAMSMGIAGDIKAEKYLIEALKDKDVLVRSNAALALGQISDKPELLIDVLDDASWMVRHDAIIALGQMDSSKHVDKIIPLVEDDVQEVREQVIKTLGHIGGKKALETVREFIKKVGPDLSVAESLSEMYTDEVISDLKYLYKEGEQQVREVAIKNLGRRKGVPVDIFLEAITDSSWRVREEAAKALGSFHDEEAIVLPALYRRLKDKNAYVVEASLKSLAIYGKEVELEKIKPMLEHDEPIVRSAAAKALGASSDMEAQDILISSIYSQSNPVVVWSIADALGEISMRSDTKRIKEEIKTESGELLCILAVALGNAGDPAAADYLTSCMVHPSWKFRQKSIEAAGNIDLNDLSETRMNKLVKTLTEVISDTDRWVRAAAVEVLYNMLKDDVNPDLSKYIKEALVARMEIENDEDVIQVLNKTLE